MLAGLKLRNYIPLAKNGVSYVELNTNDIFNILIGRNGFGKTSLLREMSPEPPDNADYGEDGYKEWLHFDKRGTYQLMSHTGKNSSHEFIFNGVNLNEGKTLLVQRELVKVHFGITSSVRNVLTGLDQRDLFTMLSPGRRKDFLMAANPNDTTYALKVFDKLKSSYNTIRGGLRTQRQNLVVEEGRMNQLASMDKESLQKEITNMDSQLKEALVLHGMLSQYNFESVRPLKEEIDQTISKLMSYDFRIKHTKGQYKEMAENTAQQLERRKEMVTRLAAVLAEVTIQLQGLDNSSANLEGYEIRLKQVQESLGLFEDELLSSAAYLQYQPVFNQGNVELDELINIHGSELVDQIQQVVKAADLEITSQKFVEVREKLAHLVNEKGNLESKITQLNHQINHYKNADSLDCPECKTNFKPGFEKVDPVKLEHERDDFVKSLESLSVRIKRYEGYIESNEDWFMSMDALMRFIKRIGTPACVIELVRDYQVGKSETSVLVENIKRTGRYKNIERQVEQLGNERETLTAQIKFLKSSDVNALFLRAEEVERELAISQREVIRLTEEYRNFIDCIEVINSDGIMRDHLQNLISEMKVLLERNGKSKIKIAVENVINDISPRKDQMLSNLIRVQSLHSVIESIKNNIADLERKEKHTLLLMDGLSPVKGLIGHLMNDFLKAIIGNMNAMIKNIWSKRLVILNCETGKGDEDSVDLSYKFPVISGDTDRTNKDIGDCSGGEREIINFAFRLTMLRYFGVEVATPLFMDEVGVAFDELHRKNFCVWTDEQYRLDKLPQTFLISHYVQQFGNFQDVNVIALNTEGLNVPVPVNKKSVIH